MTSEPVATRTGLEVGVGRELRQAGRLSNGKDAGSQAWSHVPVQEKGAGKVRLARRPGQSRTASRTWLGDGQVAGQRGCRMSELVILSFWDGNRT